MTNYPGAKQDWMDLLKIQSDDRDVDLKIDEFDFLTRENIIGKVRATCDQDPPINLYVTKEIEFINNTDLSEYSEFYTVVLDIHTPWKFDPKSDDFYPIHKITLENPTFVSEKKSDGEQLLKFSPDDPPFRKWRSNWDLLF